MPSTWSETYVTERDEKDIVIRLHAGDGRALEALHRRYWHSLVASASRYVYDSDIACDVVQDVFVDLWERRAIWHPRSSIAAYLYGAVRNRALSVARHNRVVEKHRWNEIDIAPLVPDSLESLEAADLATLLRSRILSLPERCRETFLLYRSGDLTVAEVAQVMEVSTETAKTQIKRAVAALREVVRSYRK